jgi:hypothetical protein
VCRVHTRYAAGHISLCCPPGTFIQDSVGTTFHLIAASVAGTAAGHGPGCERCAGRAFNTICAHNDLSGALSNAIIGTPEKYLLAAPRVIRDPLDH